MYKVFINDKEVRFSAEKVEGSNDSIELSPDLNSAEIVTSVQTCKIHENRVFYILSEKPELRFTDFISYFPVIPAAGGVVRNKLLEGAILMIYRLGKWDLPKGKIDAGENPEQAALREVTEECGIHKLEIISKLADTNHLYEFKGVMVLKTTNWYLMSSTDTGILKPQTEEGITEVKWIKDKDIYFLLPQSYSSISDLLSRYVLNS